MATLKSITMDDVTIPVNDTFDIDATKDMSVSANTWTDGASVTITEKGVYGIFAYVQYAALSTTGQVARGIRCVGLGGSRGNSGVDATNAQVFKNMSGVQKYNAGDTITVQALSGRAGNVSTYIKATKIYALGGVIHRKTLENSICYRPLKFGKAVA